jgi:hypothetical protein
MTATEADAMFDAVWDRSGHFSIEMEYDVAVQFIKRIGGYNEFTPPKVLKALEEIDEIIPRAQYGEGNPNNGSRDYKIRVGREGSPVIYITRYELHRFGSPAMALDGEKVRLIEAAMKTEGAADEADTEITDHTAHGMGKSYEFRFWWD